MVCSTGGFPQLLHLRFCSLEELLEVQADEQAMQILEKFEIWSCQRMKGIDGLENLKTLRQLKLSVVSEQLKKIIEKTKVQFWNNIADPPAIIID